MPAYVAFCVYFLQTSDFFHLSLSRQIDLDLVFFIVNMSKTQKS